MAIKKERTNRQKVTAEDWSLLTLTRHVRQEAVTADFGLFTAAAVGDPDARPLETKDVKIQVKKLDKKSYEQLVVLLEDAMIEEMVETDGKWTGRKGPLAGGVKVAD